VIFMPKQRRCSNFRRRLASQLLKCGGNRIWFNPTALQKINQAITRADIRKLISSRDIKKIPAVKRSHAIVKRKQRRGSRKGAKGGRQPKKKNWLKIIRPQRRVLRELRSEGKLVTGAYRKIYPLVKSGAFRSKAHLRTFMEEKKMVNKK